MALLRTSTKTKVLIFVCFNSCPCFVDEKLGKEISSSSINFHDTNVTDLWLTENPRSLIAFLSKSSKQPMSETVAYKL